MKYSDGKRIRFIYRGQRLVDPDGNVRRVLRIFPDGQVLLTHKNSERPGSGHWTVDRLFREEAREAP